MLTAALILKGTNVPKAKACRNNMFMCVHTTIPTWVLLLGPWIWGGPTILPPGESPSTLFLSLPKKLLFFSLALSPWLPHQLPFSEHRGLIFPQALGQQLNTIVNRADLAHWCASLVNKVLTSLLLTIASNYKCGYFIWNSRDHVHNWWFHGYHFCIWRLHSLHNLPYCPDIRISQFSLSFDSWRYSVYL